MIRSSGRLSTSALAVVLSARLHPGLELLCLGDDVAERAPAGFQVPQLRQETLGIFARSQRALKSIGLVERRELLDQARLDGHFDPDAKMMTGRTRLTSLHGIDRIIRDSCSPPHEAFSTIRIERARWHDLFCFMVVARPGWPTRTACTANSAGR